MARLTVRAAKTEDARAIAEIHVASWRAAYRDIFPSDYLAALSVEQRHDFWRGLIAKPGASKVAVAEVDGAIDAFCSYGPTRDDDEAQGVAEIYAIYAAPGKWRRGAGRALLEHAGRDAAVRECRAMTAWAFRENESARGFYERVGFAPDGAVRTDTSRLGRPLDEVRYRRSI